jgi:hypothetical protein
MPARSLPQSLAPARRLGTRMALVAAVFTLVATGVVALPASSDLKSEVADKIQTLAAGRAGVGWERTAETGHPTQVVGFEWQGAEAGAVEVRGLGPDGWSDWERLEGDPVEGPDIGSRERHDRTTAGPVWVGDAVEQVQVRVVEGSLRGLKLHALRSEDPPERGGLGRVKPAGSAPAQPAIISRSSWGADEAYRSRNPGCTQPLFAPSVRFGVVHHTAGTNTYTAADSAALVRAIYHFHTHTNLWCDIGYNFLVDKFGTVFEGRFGGITSAVVGAHAEGFNTGSTGVAVLGTFTTVPLPSPAYTAVRNVLAWKLALHGVDPHGTITASGKPIRTIVGHRDLTPTACPGETVAPLLPQLRNDVGTTMGVTKGSTYHPLSPARLLDTRTGVGAPAARLGPKGSVDLKVTGVGGVPAAGITSVVLNVTATNASGPQSFLTVWPKGATRPVASNLNFTAGVSVPNLVTARVGDGGSVSIFNDLGTVDVVADVQGWYTNAADAVGSSYVPVNPARVLDTRAGSPVGAGSLIQLQVAGAGGVPATGARAVVLNMTVDRASGPESFLTVWPSATPRPVASNLNFASGPATTNLVVAQLGPDGKVNIYNNLGSVDVIADVAGWFALPASPPPGSNYFGLSPARILDTRTGAGTRLGAGATLDLTVAGAGGVPASGVSAVVLNVTVAAPTAPDSYLTFFPAGTVRPVASNLNFNAGEIVPNQVVVRVQNGKVSIYNNQGATHVIADVQGWFGTSN